MKSTLEGKKKVKWDEVKKGDLVFIVGCLDSNNKPQCCFGPHTVVDPENKILLGSSEVKFYERWDYLLIEV